MSTYSHRRRTEDLGEREREKHTITMLLEESPRLAVKKVLAKCLQESDGAILKGFSGRYTIYTTLLFLHSKFSFFNFYFVHICICWDHARDTDDCWLFDVGYSLVTLNRELDCDPFVLLIHFSGM